MTTRVEISIKGRGVSDAPRLEDLIEQVQDFFAMIRVVAHSLAGDDAEHFEWQVVGLSKSSPARLVAEAVPLPGFSDGPQLAAQARDITARGLQQLVREGERPAYFDDNVIDAADRFAQRLQRGLLATEVASESNTLLAIGTPEAVQARKNIAIVNGDEPIHAYREIGSLEGVIQNVGTDGWGKPYIMIRSRITNRDVRCYLSGEALKALESEPVANVVWRNRKVHAIGVLRYRSEGVCTRAEVSRLDFIDPSEPLPRLADIVDRDFTGGLSTENFLERLRSGEA